MKKYKLTDTTPSWLPLFSEISESQVSVLINAGWLEEVVEKKSLVEKFESPPHQSVYPEVMASKATQHFLEIFDEWYEEVLFRLKVNSCSTVELGNLKDLRKRIEGKLWLI